MGTSASRAPEGKYPPYPAATMRPQRASTVTKAESPNLALRDPGAASGAVMPPLCRALYPFTGTAASAYCMGHRSCSAGMRKAPTAETAEAQAAVPPEGFEPPTYGSTGAKNWRNPAK
jgi:hypothetical protein